MKKQVLTIGHDVTCIAPNLSVEKSTDKFGAMQVGNSSEMLGRQAEDVSKI